LDDWRVFGDELRRLRLRSDISLRALAKSVTYDPGALSRIQNGKRQVSLGLATTLDRQLEAEGVLVELAARLLGIAAPPASDLLSEEAPPPSPSEIDDMNRRELLRMLNVAGAYFIAPPMPSLDCERLADARIDAAAIEQYAAVNTVLWNTYSSSVTKAAVFPAVCEHLDVLVAGLRQQPDDTPEHRRLAELTAELLQLAGEILFDCNRYTEAAHCYTLAATAGREAKAFDLWACALTRHSLIGVYDQNFADSKTLLQIAEGIAVQGDSLLSTRYWIATVQAHTMAGLGDADGCRRELDKADGVHQLAGPIHNGGWLRFDGSRLAEERGTCHLRLRQPDLAEQALTTALGQDLSPRRRGAVLTDLAMVGVLRRDPVEVVMHGNAALDALRQTRSGYVARKLCGLQDHLTPFLDDRHVRRLDRQITALAGGVPRS
jgi:transcriptional regulator with XRE-family HTH domain